MSREYRDEIGGTWDRPRAVRIIGDRDPPLIEPLRTNGEVANIAIVADVPIGPRTFRAEYVTASRVVPGEAWPPGSWRVLLEDAWIAMPKAPPPRQGRAEAWDALLTPHVRGAIRRHDEQRQAGR
jgi:hypothetical protein